MSSDKRVKYVFESSMGESVSVDAVLTVRITGFNAAWNIDNLQEFCMLLPAVYIRSIAMSDRAVTLTEYKVPGVVNRAGAFEFCGFSIPAVKPTSCDIELMPHEESGVNSMLDYLSHLSCLSRYL